MVNLHQAKEFQFGHLHGCLANPMEPIPELTLPPTSHSFVPEMNTDTEGHADQFRGTVPPSSLEIAVMKHRVSGAVVLIGHSKADVLQVETCSLCLIYAQPRLGAGVFALGETPSNQEHGLPHGAQQLYPPASSEGCGGR